MEPERASFGNEEKDFDTLKHPTSILRPEDLARELDEANGYLSKKEEQIIDHNSETVSPEKEQDFNDEIDIEAIIGEVGDIPAGINGGQLEEPVEVIEEFTDSQINGRDKEEKLISDIDKTLFQTLDVEDDKQSGTETGAKLNFIFKIINRAMSPILGKEIEKNVPKNTIKGAWISGAFISMMFGFDPIVSIISATGLSYISITHGSVGEVVRAAGEATWDAGLIALKVSMKISAAFGLRKNPPRAMLVDSSVDIVPKESIVVGEEIAKLVEEVEDTIMEVESVLEDAIKARDLVASEEDQHEEAERLAEEARLAEIEYLLEEARIEKEAKEAEAELLLEEARLAEEEQFYGKADETVLDLSEEEHIRIGEKKEEEVQEGISEETDSSALVETDDETIISDEEWEASIQLAEGLSDDLSGDRTEWDAARQLAKELVDEPEEDLFSFNGPNLTDADRMELIGQAARAAVEQFEAARDHENDLDILERTRRNEVKSVLDSTTPTALSNHSEDKEIPQKPNYEQMTVIILKEKLREKGLKLSGRKADLILRLQEYDINA